MPVPTFSMFDFCNSPSYAGVLEVRLTTAAIAENSTPTLASLVEAVFKGYRRATGPDIWKERRTQEGFKFFLVSKSLTWVCQAPPGVTITAAVLVGILNGVETVQSVTPLSAPRVLSETTAGLTLFVRHAGEKVGP